MLLRCMSFPNNSTRRQLVQNRAERPILCGRKSNHITPLLKHVHWLPEEKWIVWNFIVHF